MKRPITWLRLGAGLVACATALGAALPPPVWLVGTWRLERTDGIVIQEVWSLSSGDGLQGEGQIVRDGQTRKSEQLRIVVDPAIDQLVYIAWPVDQAETHFVATTESTPDGLIFANPDHDFPQIIRYIRESDERVRVELEGAGAEGRRRNLIMEFERVVP